MEREVQGFHYGAVNCIQFNPSNTDIFATGSDDFTIKFWSYNTGEMMGDLKNGHDQPVNAIAFYNDGNHLISGGFDKRIQHWDLQNPAKPLKNPKFKGPHNFSVETIQFSPDYSRLVTGSRDLSWKLWQYSPASIKEIYKVPHAHFSYVMSVAFNPTGDKIVTGSYDREVRMWNVENGERLAILEPKQEDSKSKKKKKAGTHDTSVSKVAWSSQGIIGSIDVSGIAKLWNEKGEEITTITAHTGGCHIEFSKDGSYFVTTGEDGFVVIRKTSDYSIVKKLSTDGIAVKAAAIAPDNSKIVYGDESGRVFCVDI